jgi:TRAP-type mannitol/chloroaromatic compound transport system substrate-binding protein
VNAKSWSELPKDYQGALEAAAFEGNTLMLARYDAGNPTALKRLVAGGTQLRPYPPAIMQASYKAAMELYAEISAKNPKFRKLIDHQMKFLEDQILWFRVCEANYDRFMQNERKKA